MVTAWERANMTGDHERRKRMTGEFDWDGITYQGTHEPLVTLGR